MSDPHNKHSNIQYQFPSILPSPHPHNKHSHIQYQFLSILPSPEPHNKNTVTFNISSSLYCPPHTLTTNTVTFTIISFSPCTIQQLAMPSRLTVVLVSLLLATPAVIFWSSSYQNITAGVANSSFVLSHYTFPTVQSQTAINPFQPKLILVHTTVTGTCHRAYKTCKNWPVCSYVGWHQHSQPNAEKWAQCAKITTEANGQKACILRTDEKHDTIWHHGAGKG